jgi:leader peptidase (prepilin peptidase)/N-methyltransferase
MIEIFLAFLAGLLIGSFLNVCIFRLPRDLSVVTPARSFCPFCEETIAWYDNIPLLSYILLRGKCRRCGVRIPLRYPVVEFATAVAFAISVTAFGVTLPALKYALFSAIMITLIASDFEERILPDEFTIGGTLLAFILAWFVPLRPEFVLLILPYSLGPRWLSLGEALLGAVVSGGSIWLVGWIFEKVRHKEGLGFGDVKMIMMIGAFLGLPAALLTLIAGSLV